MKVFPQRNTPGMTHIPPTAEGNHASSTRYKTFKNRKDSEFTEYDKKEKAYENTFVPNNANNSSRLKKMNMLKMMN
jgi:hypothetical protein